MLAMSLLCRFLSRLVQCKRFVSTYFGVTDGLQLQVGSALTTGFVVSVALAPFDTVSVRLYNQPAPAEGPLAFLTR